MSDVKFKFGERYKTRDGRRARYLGQLAGGRGFRHLFAVKDADGCEVARHYLASGRFTSDANESPLDVLPPTRKVVRWVVPCHSDYGGSDGAIVEQAETLEKLREYVAIRGEGYGALAEPQCVEWEVPL